jgi:hypothetical protein
MAKSVLPPKGLSAIDSMAWIRDAGLLVALGHPTERRMLWKLDAFAKQDSEALRRLWLSRGCSYYAFRLPSNIIVIDIDENAVEQWRKMQREFGLRNTRIVRSPSNGLHAYIYIPAGAEVAHGVDMLRDAGYTRCDIFTENSTLITGPGSRRVATPKKRGGVYSWVTSEAEPSYATDRFIELIRKKEAPEVEIAPRSDFSGDMTPYARKALDGEVSAVSSCGEGGRQAQLYRSSARLGNLIGAGLLPEGLCKRELYAAAVANKLVAEDGVQAAKMTISNGIKAGQATPRNAPKKKPRRVAARPGQTAKQHLPTQERIGVRVQQK